MIDQIEKFRLIDPSIQAQTIVLFLHVARSPGLTLRELQDRTGLISSTVSRNIARLSDEDPGYGLITKKVDVNDQRTKLVTLTPKGQQLMKVLQS